MKKIKLNKILSTVVALVLFAGMSMASSSTTKKESSSVKINDQGTTADKVQDSNDAVEDTTSVADNEIKYEITHTTFTHYTNSINREAYCGIVEITNTGNTYLYLGQCKFDFEDDNGHLLESDDLISNGPDVIAPGEKGYFFEDGLLDEGVSLDNGINLVPNFTVEVAKKGADALVDYEISDLDIRDADYGLGVKVTGRVTNNSGEETNSVNVKIIAVFFDSNGEILDVSFTYADEMGVGGKTSFELSTTFGNKEFSVSDVADYKVIARKTTYNF